jgi:hypothetical protein
LRGEGQGGGGIRAGTVWLGAADLQLRLRMRQVQQGLQGGNAEGGRRESEVKMRGQEGRRAD